MTPDFERATRILRMRGLGDFRTELPAQSCRHARPGLSEQPQGWRDMTIADPFGNHLAVSELRDG